MNDWIAVCRVDDIPVLGARRVARERGAAVAVFRTADDRVFALLDRCPHKGGPLSQGIVFGDGVACPLHNWTHRPGRRLRACARRRLHADVRGAGGATAGCCSTRRSCCTHAIDRGRRLMRRVSRCAETRSTCPYCGVGCGVIIESDGAQITGVRGDPEHPANFGRLCTKGSTLHLTRRAACARRRCARCSRCAARRAARRCSRWAGTRRSTRWPTASPTSCSAHGPDAVGLYLSGQLLTEDYYVFNKLAKGLIGTNNVDTNSRLCMSSAVAGYKASLGADAPPACYDDLALAQTVFITGSNMAWAHPVLFRRLEDARAANPAQKWIVVDPRRTETAAEADLHLQLLPGTDVVLHHALLHVMLWEGLTDAGLHRRAHHAASTPCATACASSRRRMRPRSAACEPTTSCRRRAGSPACGDDGTRTPTLSLWCQGLNQSSSGTDKNSTLINLHLATGQIGKPGAGPLSLTGQPNAMGGREVGGLANLLQRAPRPGQPRAPRRSRRAVGRGRGAGAARQERGGDVPGRGRRARSRRCGSSAPTPRSRCPTRRWCGARWSAASSSSAGGLRAHRHRRLCRPAAAGQQLGREGGHRHQQRAPHQPRARRRAARRARRATTGRSRSTWRGGWKRGCARRTRPPGRRDDVPVHHARAGVERTPREHARPRPRHHRPELRARWHEPQQWPFAAGAAEGTARLYADGSFRHRRRPRPLRRAGLARPGRAARRALPGLADHRPPARPVARHEPHRHARAGCSRTAASRRSRCTRRSWRAAARGRRPGARELAPRHAGAAGAAQRRGGAGAGLHRHALGQRVPRRAGREWADQPGHLPAVAAARAEARGGARRSGRAALAAGRRRLAAGGAGAGRCASGCARCCRALPTPAACPSAASPTNGWACAFAPRMASAAGRCVAAPRSSAFSAWPAHPCCAMPTRAAASGAAWRCTTTARCAPSCWPATSAPPPGCWSCCSSARRPRPSAARCWRQRQPPQAVAPAQPAGLRLPRRQRGTHRGRARPRRAGSAERAPASSCSASCAAAPSAAPACRR